LLDELGKGPEKNNGWTGGKEAWRAMNQRGQVSREEDAQSNNVERSPRRGLKNIHWSLPTPQREHCEWWCVSPNPQSKEAFRGWSTKAMIQFLPHVFQNKMATPGTGDLCLQLRATRNPRYSGGRDQEDHGLKPTQANSSWDPILKRSNTKKGW
jgi:hypothetical protein